MENNDNEIAEFIFTKGSQSNPNLQGSESYQFVEGIFNRMLSANNIDTPQISLSGNKEDLCLFITGIIEYHINFRDVNIEFHQIRTSEIFPDPIEE